MDSSSIAQSLGRIEATLVSVKEKLESHEGADVSLSNRITTLDARIHKLESTNLRVGSIVGTVLFFVGLLGGATLSGLAQVGNIFK